MDRDNQRAKIARHVRDLRRHLLPILDWIENQLGPPAPEPDIASAIETALGMEPGEDGESLNDRHYWVLSQLAQDVKLTKHHVMAHYGFSERSAIDTAGLTGINALRHLLAENDMNASDLGRLLSVHPSRGSKILKGERSLTVDHLRKLADCFKVHPELSWREHFC